VKLHRRNVGGWFNGGHHETIADEVFQQRRVGEHFPPVVRREDRNGKPPAPFDEYDTLLAVRSQALEAIGQIILPGAPHDLRVRHVRRARCQRICFRQVEHVDEQLAAVIGRTGF
jgi:hypothetical protein